MLGFKRSVAVEGFAQRRQAAGAWSQRSRRAGEGCAGTTSTPPHTVGHRVRRSERLICLIIINRKGFVMAVGFFFVLAERGRGGGAFKFRVAVVWLCQSQSDLTLCRFGNRKAKFPAPSTGPKAPNRHRLRLRFSGFREKHKVGLSPLSIV
jgi:hypothetical protein